MSRALLAELPVSTEAIYRGRWPGRPLWPVFDLRAVVA
jgi:hypothetical protein